MLLTVGLQKEEKEVAFTTLKQLVVEAGGVLLRGPQELTAKPLGTAQPSQPQSKRRRLSHSGHAASSSALATNLVTSSGAVRSGSGGEGEVFDNEWEVLVVGSQKDNHKRSGLPIGMKVWGRETLIQSVLRNERLWKEGGGIKPLFTTKA